MFSVFLGNSHLGTFPAKDEPLFLSMCKDWGIEYQRNEERKYLLYPPLKSLTVALYPVTEGAYQKNRVVTRLADSLSYQGALVVYTTPAASYNKLLQALKVQIFVSFNSRKSKKEQGKVRFFYSLRHKEESLKIIAAVIKEIAQQKQDINYEIPSLWEYIPNYRYGRFYFADAPTILMEVNDLEEYQIEQVGQVLLDGLLRLYGNMPDTEKVALVREILGILENVPEPEPLRRIIMNKEPLDSEPESLPLPAQIQDEIEIVEAGEWETDALSIDVIEEGSIRTVKTDLPLKAAPASSPPKPLLPKKSKTVKKPAPVLAKKVKKYRGTKSSLMFPPSDGPVFQFSTSGAGEDVYSPIPGKLAEERSIYRREGLGRRPQTMPDNNWETPQQGASFAPLSKTTYNALDELKNLMGTVKTKEN